MLSEQCAGQPVTTKSLAMSSYMRIFLLVILLLASTSASSSENMSDHEQFCAHNKTVSCDVYLQQQLAKTKPYSAQWFKVTSYQLDYFFDHQKFDELQQQIESLLQRENLPQSFSVQLYFYYAKVMNRQQKRDVAELYANKAMAGLEQIYQMFGEPFRLLELANLQYQLGAREKSDEILTYTEQRFAKSKDPLFRFELYSNKALLSHANQDLALAADERQQALDAALALGHSGKITVGYGNLARTQQLLGQLELARDNYLASLPYLARDNNLNVTAIHKLRLAEIFWQLRDDAQARNFLGQVDASRLSSNHLALYQQLIEKSTAKKP